MTQRAPRAAREALATGIFCLLGTYRARALQERIVASEHVDDDDVAETMVEAFAHDAAPR